MADRQRKYHGFGLGMIFGSGFWQVHEKSVVDGLRVPWRNLRGTKHGEGRGYKIRKEEVEDRETTDL